MPGAMWYHRDAFTMRNFQALTLAAGELRWACGWGRQHCSRLAEGAESPGFPRGESCCAPCASIGTFVFKQAGSCGPSLRSRRARRLARSIW